ncbi:hypothetical protein [Nonomuraea sediminis]|uniref:hypothetical protein n=1 Tax=Nonomuraea sediminis TaxID=2835864 RepID=UPI00202A179B|nr:hypothetical protein [Nonomuraea sediminis]
MKGTHAVREGVDAAYAHVLARAEGPIGLGAGVSAPAGMARLTHDDSTGVGVPVWPDGVTPSLLEEYQVAPVPVERAGESRRVLAACLKCCWTDLSTDPWPGSPAPLDQVLDTYRALIGRTDDLMRNWAIGALRRLHDSAWVVMTDGVVRLGPRCATWPVESYALLKELLRRLPEPDRTDLITTLPTETSSGEQATTEQPPVDAPRTPATSSLPSHPTNVAPTRSEDAGTTPHGNAAPTEDTDSASHAHTVLPQAQDTGSVPHGDTAPAHVGHEQAANVVAGQTEQEQPGAVVLAQTADVALHADPAPEQAEDPTQTQHADVAPEPGRNAGQARRGDVGPQPAEDAVTTQAADVTLRTDVEQTEDTVQAQHADVAPETSGNAGQAPPVAAEQTEDTVQAQHADDMRETSGNAGRPRRGSVGVAARVVSESGGRVEGASGDFEDLLSGFDERRRAELVAAFMAVEYAGEPVPEARFGALRDPALRHTLGEMLARRGRVLVQHRERWISGYADGSTARLQEPGLSEAERAVLTLVLVHSVAIPRAEGMLPEDSWLSPHPTAAEELRRHTQLPIGELEGALRTLRHAGLLGQVKAGEEAGGYVPGPQFHRLTPAARRRLQEELILAAGPHTPLAAAVRAKRSSSESAARRTARAGSSGDVRPAQSETVEQVNAGDPPPGEVGAVTGSG